MTGKLIRTALALFVVLGWTAPARAGSIQWGLNATIIGNVVTPSTTFGWVTLTDDLSDFNFVDVRVELLPNADGTARQINQFYLNWLGTLTPGHTFWAVPLNSQLNYAPNAINVAGSGNYAALDLELRNPTPSPLEFRLVLGAATQQGNNPVTFSSYTDLDVSQFIARDTRNNFYAAVHIGNYQGSSIAVGAGCTVGDPGCTPPQVPEPASMLLLGTGLLGAGLAARRRRK